MQADYDTYYRLGILLSMEILLHHDATNTNDSIYDTMEVNP